MASFEPKPTVDRPAAVLEVSRSLKTSSSDTSCLTTADVISDVKSGQTSPRSEDGGGADVILNDASDEFPETSVFLKQEIPDCKGTAKGESGGGSFETPTEIHGIFQDSEDDPLSPVAKTKSSEAYLGEIFLPEGSLTQKPLNTLEEGTEADPWASILDCNPEDILQFSYEDIDQLTLPEQALVVGSVFPDHADVIPDSNLGEPINWESLALPDIYDFCPGEGLSVAATARGAGPKRKAPSPPQDSIVVVLGPIPGKHRSKRGRASSEKQPWSPGLLQAIMERPRMQRVRMEGYVHGERSQVPFPCSTDGPSSNEADSADGSSLSCKRGSELTESGVLRRCSHCATTKTPQWRAGPNGPKTLCNACGVRFKSGRLCSEYRPASSPEFEVERHSNSHRKIVERRRMREQGVDEGTLLAVARVRPPAGQRRCRKGGGHHLKKGGQHRKGGQQALPPLSLSTHSANPTEGDTSPLLATTTEDLPVSRISFSVMCFPRKGGSEGGAGSVAEQGKEPLGKAGENTAQPQVYVSPLLKESKSLPPSPCMPDFNRREQQALGGATADAATAAAAAGAGKMGKVVGPSPLSLVGGASLLKEGGQEGMQVEGGTKQGNELTKASNGSVPAVMNPAAETKEPHGTRLQKQKEMREQQKGVKQNSHGLAPQQLLQQQQQVVVGQVQQQVYYPHSLMLFPPALPQIPFLRPPRLTEQPFPIFQHQMLFQQHQQQQALVLQKVPQQQEGGGVMGKENVLQPVAFAPSSAPSSPQTPDSTCSAVTPTLQEGTQKVLAAGLVGQGGGQKGGEQERLRDQLRKRQEKGQSIRRQHHEVSNAVSTGVASESEVAGESLPISMAYGGPAMALPARVPKVVRQVAASHVPSQHLPAQQMPAEEQLLSSGAARTTSQKGLPSPVRRPPAGSQAVPCEAKVDVTWDALPGPGSVGVEA